MAASEVLVPPDSFAVVGRSSSGFLTGENCTQTKEVVDSSDLFVTASCRTLELLVVNGCKISIAGGRKPGDSYTCNNSLQGHADGKKHRIIFSEILVNGRTESTSWNPINHVPLDIITPQESTKLDTMLKMLTVQDMTPYCANTENIVYSNQLRGSLVKNEILCKTGSKNILSISVEDRANIYPRDGEWPKREILHVGNRVVR